MEEQKKWLIETAETLHKSVWELAWKIGHNPEVGYKEHFAVSLLTGYLKRYGFQVERPLAGMETSFLARFKGNKPGPKIAFLAEYDALPDIGHGCGHHLIGAASVGAAVVLSLSTDLQGELVVIGSPAEETSGAKVSLVEAGLFDDIDIAMMFHPGSCNVPEISSLALDAIEVAFLGKAAHMVIANNDSINALDAMLIFFQMLEKLKRKLSDMERIDGIITQGGKSPNIVPDYTEARFYLRAEKREKLEVIRQKFLDCAYRAAAKVNAQMKWNFFECSYHEMRSNRVLADCCRNNLILLGIKEIEPPQTMLGSVDMGNVSQVVPAIHPYLRLGSGYEIPHTKDFAAAGLSEEGEKVLLLAVKLLALTAWDVISNKKLLADIQKEFKANS
ncbi:MAG: M20 family metallopeptidase [Peptococcaceae bacterium]|nr:M20 family metallopeptidase [Peptococcaceae bacterium]